GTARGCRSRSSGFRLAISLWSSARGGRTTMQETHPSPDAGKAVLPEPPPALNHNPYVGPRPFSISDGARYFGRESEANDLLYRVMAHPITMLYSMSGAGKTSLINARLIPDFQSERCRVLPSARVKGSYWKLDPAEVPNIYVFHTVICWQDHCDYQ